MGVEIDGGVLGRRYRSEGDKGSCHSKVEHLALDFNMLKINHKTQHISVDKGAKALYFLIPFYCMILHFLFHIQTLHGLEAALMAIA